MYLECELLWNQLLCFKIKFHIRCTTRSISIDLALPILFIAATADVLPNLIKIWIIWKLLHKNFNPNNEALISKIFMCCWDSSDEKSPSVLLAATDGPHLLKTHQYLIHRWIRPKNWSKEIHDIAFPTVYICLTFFWKYHKFVKIPKFLALVLFISKDL